MKTMQNYQEVIAGLSGFLFTILLMIASGIAITWFFVDPNQVVSGVQIANMDVSGMTQQEITQKLQAEVPPGEAFTLTIQKDDRHWASSSAQLHWQPNTDKAVELALHIGRTGNFLEQTSKRLLLLWKPHHIPLEYQFDQQKVRSWVAEIAQEVDQPGKPPQIVSTPYNYTIERGEKGEVVNQEKMIEMLMSQQSSATIPLAIMSIHQPLTNEEVILSEQRLKQLWGKKIIVLSSDSEPQLELSATQFFPWIQLPTGYDQSSLQKELDKLHSQYSRQPQNAKLEIDDKNNVTAFQAPLEGRSLNMEQTKSNMTKTLEQLETTNEKNGQIQLVFDVVSPDVSLEETNNLGIKERIGLGTSTFFHSIANRVYNVNLTSQRINNTLVAPGEDFSFNAQVGEISSRTGYKAAYVIRNGRTELGDGGGVCQVSTTVFRAALNAGLPIPSWKAHSYRVGYYEQNSQPGFDATVYAPSPDFKFTNNTGHHILITTSIDLENYFLRIELWGTSDGRKSTISDYSFGNVRAAPAPLYQVDPSLAPGARKQIDWAAPGGTARFHYSVKDAQGNEMYQRNFTSVYKPWQAVYLVGPTQ